MNLKSVNALANAGLVLPAGSGGGKAGKNCTIQKIEPIPGGNRVTFAWTKDEGGVATATMDVMDGEGGGSLTDELKVSMTVGGITSGKTYDAGTEIADILRDMLNPVVNPTLTPPTATLSGNFPNMVAVGQSVGAQTVTAGLNRGSINPQYQAAEPYRSGAATGYSLSMSGATVSFSDSNATGSFSLPAFTRTTKGNVTVTATASYAAGVQPTNSAGENWNTPLAAGSVSTTKTVQFVIPFRYGVVDSKTLANFDGLAVEVTGKTDKTYKFTTNDQYGVIAYDQAHGNLSKVYDQNGFDVTSDWEQYVLGESVYYVMASPTTDTNAEYSFKF